MGWFILWCLIGLATFVFVEYNDEYSKGNDIDITPKYILLMCVISLLGLASFIFMIFLYAREYDIISKDIITIKGKEK